jgi:hypothetical protein
MQIPLSERRSFRYIYINPLTNHVHLLVPIIAGVDISTDNTCKSDQELMVFFEGGATNELRAYKGTLELHLSLTTGQLRDQVDDRLKQINLYIATIFKIRNEYKRAVNTLLKQPSNLYSIQLRPYQQDTFSKVVNPVFSLTRDFYRQSTPSSPLFHEMHSVFPQLVLGKLDPRTMLINQALQALPEKPSFEMIQTVLAITANVPDNFFKVVHQHEIDEWMDHHEETSPQEYLEALLNYCTPHLETTLQGSPFYLKIPTNVGEKAERLSILTQFYLGILNVYCRARGRSDKNFGQVLDNDATLSRQLVDLIAVTLQNGDDVEQAICRFINEHKGATAFNLSTELSVEDKNAIQHKFEVAYRTVTATKENPHMDEFMVMDAEEPGEMQRFITLKGSICTNLINIIPITTTDPLYFTDIYQESATQPTLIEPKDEPAICVEIQPEVLIATLRSEQWAKLPQDIVVTCQALPAFKLHQLLDHVAKENQEEVETILNASPEAIQYLLSTPGQLTDQLDRSFLCTAYEYAYWANNASMCQMLEPFMDEEIKTLLLEKMDAIDHAGLSYEQHGISYQSPHDELTEHRPQKQARESLCQFRYPMRHRP